MEVPSGRAWRRVEPYAMQKSTDRREEVVKQADQL
jgi:hypothetical protein